MRRVVYGVFVLQMFAAGVFIGVLWRNMLETSADIAKISAQFKTLL